MAKLAKRMLKRINGVLKIVFVDVDTGQVLSDLNGYDVISQADAVGEYNPDKKNGDDDTKKPEQPNKQEGKAQGGSSRSESYTPFTESEWYTDPNRSKGSGDILADLKAAGGNLRERVDNIKTGIGNAAIETAGKVIGGMATLGGTKAEQDASINAATQNIRNVGDTVQGAVKQVTDPIKQGINSVVDPIKDALGIDTPSATGGTINWGKYGENLQGGLTDVINKAASGVNFDITIASGYRDTDHNAAAGGAKGSEHTHGNAVDISLKGLSDGQRSALVDSLIEAGATRIGAYSGNTGLHVDMKAVAPPDGYKVWPMYDTTIQNMGKAPDWFKSTVAGKPLAEAAQYRIKAPDTVVPPTTQTAAQPNTNKVASTGANPTGIDPSILDAVNRLNSARGLPPVSAPTAVATATPVQPSTVQPAQLPDITPSIAPSNKLQQPTQQTFAGQEAAPPVQRTGFADDPKLAGLGGLEDTLKQGETIPSSVNKANNQPYLDAFLDTINYAEGAPRENQLFGYGEFSDFNTHPNTKVAYNEGRDFSTAAGLFQINKPTFDDYSSRTGITGFDKDSQYAMARAIAEDRYNQKTGRNLGDDLASGDKKLLEGAYDALKGTWSSLPGGVQERTKLNDLMSRYETGTAFKAPSSKDISNTAVKDKMSSEPVSFQSVTKTDNSSYDKTSSSSIVSDKASNKTSYSSDKAGDSGFMSDSSPSPSKISGPESYTPSSDKNSGNSSMMSDGGGFASRPSSSGDTKVDRGGSTQTSGGGGSNKTSSDKTSSSNSNKTSNSNSSDKNKDKY